jgi:hypothetical protein
VTVGIRLLPPTGAAVAILVSWTGLTLAAGGPHQTGPSGCIPNVDKTVAPPTILLGETATVTLAVNVPATEACPPPGLHVVLVLDDSAALKERLATERMRAAGNAFVHEMRLGDNPGRKIGVVAYGSKVETLCQLTNRKVRVQSCIDRVGPGYGDARLDLAIEEGLRTLLRGRGEVVDRGRLVEVLIVVPAAANRDGCSPVLAAAAQAKAQGAHIYALCFGPHCDADCVRYVPNTRAQFRHAPDPALAATTMRPIASDILGIRALHLAVTDQLPANIELVLGSPWPFASYWDPAVRVLAWDFRQPASPLTMTFQIRPLEVGHWPTNVRAAATLTDFGNQVVGVDFPVPRVAVLAPNTLPTPPGPPTPTAIPASTALPGSPTPTPNLQPAFLPWCRSQ